MAPLNVAYQGVPGAYSEKAVCKFLGPAPYVNPIGYPTFEKVFEAVQSNQVEYAVIPIENSLGGSIHTNYDLLIKFDLKIVAEYDLRVEHCLMALPGVSRDQIKVIASHPQALAQCANYISDFGKYIIPKAEYDTAATAKMVFENQLKDTAAIASDLAAKTYNLEILERNIEDDAGNFTRFLLLSKQAHAISRERLESAEYKISLVFSFTDSNQKGQLYKALSAFSLRDVDLSKIESRPWGYTANQCLLATSTGDTDLSPLPDRRKYRYIFYIDIIGHEEDVNVANALRHLRELCKFIRVLGCYPANGTISAEVRSQIDATGLPSNPKVEKPQMHKRSDSSSAAQRLRVGIYGFGNFGQFLTKTLSEYHDISVTSRGHYTSEAKNLKATFYPSNTEQELQIFLKNIDILVFAVSILSFEKVFRSIPTPLLQDLVLVDVLSVKRHPKQIMLQYAPLDCSLLCTHPMFGPESGKYSWRSLPMMFEKVRVVSDRHAEIINSFLRVFETEMCQMLEITSEIHDEYAASTQFVTHLTGRVLSIQKLQNTPIDTRGFKSLMQLVRDTCGDSMELFRGLYTYNTNSEQQIEQFKESLETIEKMLKAPASAVSPNADAYAPRNPLLRKVQAAQTVAIHALTKQLEAKGEVIHSLCVGEPDFLPDRQVLEAGAQAFYDGKTKYPPLPGVLELRRLIAQYLQVCKGVEYNPDSEILLSNGAKQSVFQALFCMCQPEDQVLIPSPYWVSYPEMVKLVNAAPIILETKIEDNYIIDPNALKNTLAAHPKIKVLILCNPSNPAGTMHEPHHLAQIAEILRMPQYQHIVVISDEIYEQLIYQDPMTELRIHQCFASLPGMYERTIVINGFSKSHAMPGLRLGYMAAPKIIVQACAKLQGQLTTGANTVGQHAACKAMKIELEAAKDPQSPPRITETLKIMDKKRQYVVARIKELPHVQYVYPTAAFYVCLDLSYYFDGKHAQVRTSPDTVLRSCDDFCQYLLREYHTAVVPGSAFGIPMSLRVSYATSLETLGGAFDGLQSALASLHAVPASMK